MKTTDGLIEKFLQLKYEDRVKFEIEYFELNGSYIFVRYTYFYEWDLDSKYPEYEDEKIELLDYITFIYNYGN